MKISLYVPISDDIYDVDSPEFYYQLCNICERHLCNAQGFDVPPDGVMLTSDIARSLASNILDLFEEDDL